MLSVDRVGGFCRIVELGLWPGQRGSVSLAIWRVLVPGDTVYPATSWCPGVSV